jgi:hypothetical protein
MTLPDAQHEESAMAVSHDSNRGLIEALLSDGRFLLAVTGLALVASGGFALFLCLTGHFLPHDVAYLGMDAAQLARASRPELVGFMLHDRAAFGGSLMAIGFLYLWLVEFPLKQGEAWAWWTLAISGATGFLSFLSYLDYGYLDTWHGVATLFLLPLFLAGLVRSWSSLKPSRGLEAFLRIRKGNTYSRRHSWGRRLLLAYGGGLVFAGTTILIVGMTRVFVATDLAFVGMSRVEICGVSDRLIPVIAHDRSGFGGGLLSVGLTVIGIVLHATPSRSFHQIMVLSAGLGFISAIGVHFLVGYINFAHLAPAFAGAALFTVGWILVCGEVSAARSRVSLRAETQKAVASRAR